MPDGSDHPETPIKVRIGTPGEVHAVMAVALLACAENSFAKTNPVKLLQDVWPALNMDQGVVGIIGQPGDQIEGVVMLRIGTMFYSDEPILEERAIFVHPDFRSAKGGRATCLAEFSKMMADQLELPLTIGVLSNERTEAKIRMYSRVMGKPSGAYWLYNVQTGGHETESIGLAAE